MGCILGMASTSSCCRLAGLPLPTPPHYPLTYTSHRNTHPHSLVELTIQPSLTISISAILCGWLEQPSPFPPFPPVPRRSWCLSDGLALLADALCHRTTLQIREQKKQLADEMQVRL
jgi:hypothetical protein